MLLQADAVRKLNRTTDIRCLLKYDDTAAFRGKQVLAPGRGWACARSQDDPASL